MGLAWLEYFYLRTIHHRYKLYSEHFCLPYRMPHITYKQNMLTNHVVTRHYEGKLERAMRFELTTFTLAR